jgi:hypothetical protein
MKFAINSVVFMALVGTASVILQIWAWLKPTKRDEGGDRPTGETL